MEVVSWDAMEEAVHASEEIVRVKQAAVEAAATAPRRVLAEVCKELEDAQRVVEKMYARWQELEGKRG